jgi:tight adherence protein B
MGLDPHLLRWLGLGLAVGGGFLLLWLSLTDADGVLVRQWRRYTTHLDREARFLRLQTTGSRIATLQGLGVLGALLLALVLEEPLLLAAAALVAVGPNLVLRRRHAERVEKVEAQLDGWLLVLANSLRAAPSLGDAIESSSRLVDAPLSEELDTTIKEMRLGTPVDRAVLELGSRIDSRSVQGALAAIIVGRQTGGELSVILEETAASLREMTRLEGVLKAKTAEGRSQAYVLGALPFFLIVAINWVDPRWMDPLTQTSTGLLVTTVATGLWLGAILLARRILAVDL